MPADFFPLVFPSFFLIDAFSRFFGHASKDVMHVPDFFHFSRFLSHVDAASTRSCVWSKDVMHDFEFSIPRKSCLAVDASSLTALSTVQIGSRRPYRWWKARAVVAENAQWGRRSARWQARINTCVQDEDWWRGEDAWRAIRVEAAKAVEAKKLACRRLARERRRERLAAARAVQAQDEEARRFHAQSARLESLAAFRHMAQQAHTVRESKITDCEEACSRISRAQSRCKAVMQKKRMDVFFSRRCAQAGADPNNPHSSRTWNLASLESGKGVAAFCCCVWFLLCCSLAGTRLILHATWFAHTRLEVKLVLLAHPM